MPRLAHLDCAHIVIVLGWAVIAHRQLVLANLLRSRASRCAAEVRAGGGGGGGGRKPVPLAPARTAPACDHHPHSFSLLASRKVRLCVLSSLGAGSAGALAAIGGA